MITDLATNVFKRYHSGKHFSEFLPTRWRQKSTGTDTEQNYVTVTPCIRGCAALVVTPGAFYQRAYERPLTVAYPRHYNADS